MGSANQHEPHDDVEGTPAELRRTVLAIVAAWAVPGLGHVLLGRVGRGLLFAGLLLGSFGIGLAHEGRLALRDSRQPFLTTLQIVANVGIGPADLVARIFVYGKRQVRPPQYIAGLAMMIFPYFISGAALTCGIGGVLVIAMVGATRLGL